MVRCIHAQSLGLTFEFFTVYTKLAEMVILASTGLRTPKKSYLQWGSTWCKGLLLVYQSNTKSTEPLRHLLLRRSLNFCPCTTWFLDFDHLVGINRAWLYKDPKVSVLQANAPVGFFTYTQKCQLWHFCLYYMKTSNKVLPPLGIEPRP